LHIAGGEKKILDIRFYKKIYGLYSDKFLTMIRDDKLYTRLFQVDTKTGRYKSSGPNLQNISARPLIEGDENSSLRTLFIPTEGRIMIGADYSQQELKLMALLSGDPVMMHIYLNNGDIHKKTADSIGINRKSAKSINFGIGYGLSAMGLKDDLEKYDIKVTLEDCEKYIDSFHKTYKKAKAMLDYNEECIKKVHFIRSISGRKRRFYDIQSGEERQANNFIMQGSAADMIKAAIGRIVYNMDRNRAALVLQIHDELLFECDLDYVEEFKKLIKWGMEGVFKTKLEFTADIKVGRNWYEAH